MNDDRVNENVCSDAFAPHLQVRNVDSASARWTTGFWADRFELCRETILPEMRRALEDPDNGAVLSNFAVAAGLEEGGHRGTVWSDGDCYKWMEAVAHVYEMTRDEALDRALDELIEAIARAQDEDGYLCTQIQLTDRKRWQRRSHHELYNMGHLLTAACVHHRATGKDSFLQVARRLGDYLYRTFQPRPPELAHYGWNPSNIMGLVDLYRTTGESRYLELAGIFVDMRGSAPPGPGQEADDGTDQNQDRVPLRQESHAVGHAVTATYLYCGAADVYAETGEAALLAALERIWLDTTSRRMYVTGAVGAHHHAVSRRGDRVWEAFGLDHQLPNATAYNETCANIGHAMWNRRMLQITGESKYADVMEQVLYNSTLSAMSADGTRFCYTNPLRWHGEQHDLLSQDTPERWFIYDCYCCPPQVARTIAQLHQWACGVSEQGVWVHLYGGSRLEIEWNGAPLRWVQETDYPWDGRVTITFEEASGQRLSLILRVPAWAQGAELSHNGHRVEVEGSRLEARGGAYLSFDSNWHTGDSIELVLPLEPRLVQAHPRVEEARNQAAVLRGPVVYCLESVDLPEGVRVSEIHLPRDIRLAPRHRDDLLGGVTVLEGEARRLPEGDWEHCLYRDLDRAPAERIPITLIPYFAWGNRGPGEMTVWMPVVQSAEC